MRFIVDECTGPAVARWLQTLSHEVFSVLDEAGGASDDEILDKAWNENWIVVTNDKDFGEKVYRENRRHHGIVLLRLDDERSPSKIAAMEKLLNKYADHLPNSFVVVTENQTRFGK